MLFMVIERFKDNDMVPIYRQVRDGSRLLPDGLKYLDKPADAPLVLGD